MTFETQSSTINGFCPRTWQDVRRLAHLYDFFVGHQLDRLFVKVLELKIRPFALLIRA